MPRLSDFVLITQVVTFGNERAFGQLVSAHQEAVRRFLRRLTAGDAMLADDLAQETFIRAWQHLKDFRQLSGFETWLFRIAYRVFLDEKRKKDALPTLSIGEEAVTFDRSNSSSSRAQSAPSLAARAGREIETTGGESDRFSLRHDLDLALSTLSETERTCVVLQCVEGQSIKEIAQITDMNENTVKSHLLRGKKKLANYLRRNGYNE